MDLELTKINNFGDDCRPSSTNRRSIYGATHVSDTCGGVGGEMTERERARSDASRPTIVSRHLIFSDSPPRGGEMTERERARSDASRPTIVSRHLIFSDSPPRGIVLPTYNNSKEVWTSLVQCGGVGGGVGGEMTEKRARRPHQSSLDISFSQTPRHVVLLLLTYNNSKECGGVGGEMTERERARSDASRPTIVSRHLIFSDSPPRGIAPSHIQQ
ncbi:hypothetical protein J6590_018823 [Homalodisca vitripennis]|nr:hypothetical protein J6590_018823 [Homalodisca vitripennis]